MKRAPIAQLSAALDRGAARAEGFEGPPMSALCMLAQRRTALPMADRRTKRAGRGSDRRQAVREGAEG